MWQKPSLMLRIAIGKTIGFILGIIGAISLPYFYDSASPMLQLGVLFWYTTIGAFIGVFGVFTYHPVLKMPMPWWLRASAIGAWMNLVLVLFAYDTFAAMTAQWFDADSLFASPFWFVFEGCMVGLLIGYLATRFGGEGKEAVD